jgi:hypothetical protein
MLVTNIVWPPQCSQLSQLEKLTKHNFYGIHTQPSFALSAHNCRITSSQGNGWSHMTSCAVWHLFCIIVLEMYVGMWRCVVYHITFNEDRILKIIFFYFMLVFLCQVLIFKQSIYWLLAYIELMFQIQSMWWTSCIFCIFWWHNQIVGSKDRKPKC